MPECPEIVILTQYLNKIKKYNITKFEILGGKYLRKPFNNFEIFENVLEIVDINSKGKLIWFELLNVKTNETIYMTSHLGLTGFWSFNEDKAKIKIHLEKNDKKKELYYEDDRNFGNINVYLTKEEFENKINELSVDVLKDDYDFVTLFKKFSNYKKNSEKNIVNVLMEQKKNKGIVSGIGNYLMAEILYNAKISPFRTIGSLNDNEIKTLEQSIKYIVKLSYYYNDTGYMTNFDKYIKKHHEDIINGKYPDYHSEIKLEKNDKFEFNVYGKKKDLLGNIVEIDKTIQGDRSTYYVSSIQK